MQIHKEMLLFCTLLVLSLGLLIASNLKKIPDPPAENSHNCSKCCHKEVISHSNATPWNILTEGMLHIART